jgi:hypothetical protein
MIFKPARRIKHDILEEDRKHARRFTRSHIRFIDMKTADWFQIGPG